MKEIILKKGKDAPVRRYHQWIFSGAIQHLPKELSNGDLVKILASNKDFLGIGHYQDGSIAVRIITFKDEPINEDFWYQKLLKAYQLRDTLGLTENLQTNTYRLIHAESDGLPGLIIDIYNGTAVVQAHSIGMHKILNEATNALKRIYGDKLKAVYDKSAETLHQSESHPENSYLYQKEDTNEVLEYGNKFSIDWVSGQKTGFFIDQRENRQLLASYSRNKKVLNTFCYSGGFSVFALNAGASFVHSVDISEKAIELTKKNVLINGFDDSKHSAIAADVMKYIKDVGNDYDIIVLDPPAFAKHLNARHNAVQAYKRLNALAISKIKAGGIIFTFSCSQVVDKVLFNHTIAAAAIEAGRNVKILHYLHQPQDHPINIFHPETEYLKGLVLYVE